MNHHHAEMLRGSEEGYYGGGGLAADLSFLKDPWKKRRRTLVAFGRATSDEAFTASIYDLAVRSALSSLFLPSFLPSFPRNVVKLSKLGLSSSLGFRV
jgi:hypothetical protein